MNQFTKIMNKILKVEDIKTHEKLDIITRHLEQQSVTDDNGSVTDDNGSVVFPEPSHSNLVVHKNTDKIVATDIMSDGMLLGFQNWRPRISKDLGKTWEILPSGLDTNDIHGQNLMEMNDGHLVHFGLDTVSNEGVISRTNNNLLDETTVWEEKYRTEPGKGFPSYAPYGFDKNENVVLANSYPNSAPVLLSIDYGNTWKEILSLNNIRHVHDVHFDPYTKRIWVATGDGEAQRNVLYSDDWGDNWETLWTWGKAPTQSTSIISRPDCVLFGSDVNKHASIWRYDKQTKTTSLVYETALTEINTVTSLGAKPFNELTEEGRLITWLPFMREDNAHRNRLIATGDGINFYKVYEDPEVGQSPLIMGVLGKINNQLILNCGVQNVGLINAPNWYS